MRKKYAALAILTAWLLVLYFTHLGQWSPYSYGWAMFGGESRRIFGRVVNPDAEQMLPAAMFLYDGTVPSHWEIVTNLRLPIHPFLLATLQSFTRSYLFSSDLLNLGVLALLFLIILNFAEQQGVRIAPVVVAVMTLTALPFVSTYIAQPMQYITGVTINFLAVIAVCALSEEDLRRPVIAAIPVAVMLLNYDPYIYVAAVVLYLFFVVRFRRVVDGALFVVLSLAPVIVWTEVMRAITNDHLSRSNEKVFIRPVLDAWHTFLQHPMENALQPYLAGHIGLHIGAHMILVTITWPLLLLGAAALWRLRSQIPRSRSAVMVELLAGVFVAHQMFTAAFDWENNPRRALPFLLAFGLTYVWVVVRLWTARVWRALFALVLVVSFTAVMADRLFRVPVLTFLPLGQAMTRNPKYSMDPKMRDMRLNQTSMPQWTTDEKTIWRNLGKVDRLPAGFAARWLALQLLLAACCTALLWFVARAKLLPRYSAAVAALLFIASAVRFL